ncbi:MAG: hypothetical protein IJA79_01115 [Desulfovibrio sp.]|nr:hypothetical protein [Desulfovibrio sp.]
MLARPADTVKGWIFFSAWGTLYLHPGCNTVAVDVRQSAPEGVRHTP